MANKRFDMYVNLRKTGHLPEVAARLVLGFDPLSRELLPGETAAIKELVFMAEPGFQERKDKVQGDDAHRLEEVLKDVDPVNHPAYYTQYKGIEVIQLTEQMNFNRGNAVKYIARAGFKNKDTEIEDLQKAAWYLDREIERLKKE